MKLITLIGVILICTGLSACGGQEGVTEAPGTSASTAAGKSATARGWPTPESQERSSKVQPIPDVKRPPKVSIPAGPPPKKVVIEDLERGQGPAVRRHTWVAVHVIGIDYRSRKPFEVNWDLKRPFIFDTNWAVEHEKWQRGLLGARVGGRRKIIVPSNLAYGQGAVVYVADILEVQDKPYTGWVEPSDR